MSLNVSAFLAAQRLALKALLGRGAPSYTFEVKLLHNFHELDDIERARYDAEVRPGMTGEERLFFEGDRRLIGQMYSAERRALYDLVRQRMPRLCLEIGTWSGGGSTFFTSSALKANEQGRLVSFEVDSGLHRMASRFYRECLPDLAPFVSFELGAATPERMRALRGQTGLIEFAFLDGAENSEQTVEQFSLIRPFLAADAVVACHDWGTAKMAKLRPVLERNPEWQVLRELGPPSSVGFTAFRLVSDPR